MPEINQSSSDNSSGKPTLLVVVSAISALLYFGLSVVSARLLGPDGFHDYIVAVSAISLLGTLCEFGTGKYAMKVFPIFRQNGDWHHASGFWRFSVVLVFTVSLILAVTVIAIQMGYDVDFASHPLSVGMFFLPITALVAVVSEFVMANRATVRGALITKIICPVSTLILLFAVNHIRGSVDAVSAILCFGGAGVCGLLIALTFFFRTVPREFADASPEMMPTYWAKQCAWFLIIAFVMSWLAEVSLITLAMAGVDELEIAKFGAALKTGTIVLLVAKSTDKYYLPIMSVIMDNGDWETGRRIRNQRRWFIGSITVGFLALMIMAGKKILLLYGPEYGDGYSCLILVSFGASLFTTFSMAPQFLKYSKRFKSVLGLQFLAGSMLAILTWILGIRYGATGAGLAFCISLCAMTLTFLYLANVGVSLAANQFEARTDQSPEED